MGKFEKGKRPTQAQSYAEPQRAPKKKKQKKQSRLGLIVALLAAAVVLVGCRRGLYVPARRRQDRQQPLCRGRRSQRHDEGGGARRARKGRERLWEGKYERRALHAPL